MVRDRDRFLDLRNSRTSKISRDSFARPSIYLTKPTPRFLPILQLTKIKILITLLDQQNIDSNSKAEISNERLEMYNEKASWVRATMQSRSGTSLKYWAASGFH